LEKEDIYLCNSFICHLDLKKVKNVWTSGTRRNHDLEMWVENNFNT
jgi:hypothetical protein